MLTLYYRVHKFSHWRKKIFGSNPFVHSAAWGAASFCPHQRALQSQGPQKPGSHDMLLSTVVIYAEAHLFSVCAGKHCAAGGIELRAESGLRIEPQISPFCFLAFSHFIITFGFSVL